MKARLDGAWLIRPEDADRIGQTEAGRYYEKKPSSISQPAQNHSAPHVHVWQRTKELYRWECTSRDCPLSKDQQAEEHRCLPRSKVPR